MIPRFESWLFFVTRVVDIVTYSSVYAECGSYGIVG